MNTIRKKFEPAFGFSSSKSSILLYEGRAEVTINDTTYSGDGEVRLDLSPRAKVRLYGKFQGVSPDDYMMPMTDQKNISKFFINGRQVEGGFLDIGGDIRTQEMTVKWYPKSTPIIGIWVESTQMSYVVFHLFNFEDFIGMRRTIEHNGKTRHAIEHVDLRSDDWKVELKSLTETRNNIKTLKAEGAYKLTHIGCLEKADGSSFSGKNAAECLQALRFFLSFAKGGWCEPTCEVGFEASGNRVWESWSAPREPWHRPPSWFDPHNCDQLVNLFPGFMTKWTNNDWQEALHEAIYWYLNANHSERGIDAGIILTQAAIERLSYEFLVRDRGLRTGRDFKALKASDKFRLLFSSLNIPIDIPPEASELQQMATGQINWQDAPHALTEIRNSLVHPEHRWRGQFRNAYFEAWNLGLWYLEMSILAICGYSGTYGNRLKKRWVGQVENVPWV